MKQTSGTKIVTRPQTLTEVTVSHSYPLCLDLPSGLLSPGVPHKIYEFLFPTRVTCPAHL